ncbi:MAG: hypothetical protein E7496_03635 [Ruminococcus sp.]|nr:hypothetical protein [Ruminococcus sp.]
MKKSKYITELNEIIRDTVRENIRETVTESLKEKTDLLRALPVSGQIQETAKAFCGFSVEFFRLFLTVAECLGVFFTLIYAVRELIKEIKSPL